MLTATTTKPDLENRFCISLSDGISSTHGAHQVAQKFKTRTLPPNSSGVIRVPRSVTMLKSGALSPSLAEVSRKLKTITPIKAAAKRAIRARRALFAVNMPGERVWATVRVRVPCKLLEAALLLFIGDQIS